MPDAASAPSFEKALEELQRIVTDLEDGKLELEQALNEYEQGVVFLKQCYGLLQKAEQRIQVLTGVDESGQPITKPFEPVADAKPAAETARRRRPAEAEPSGDPLFRQ